MINKLLAASMSVLALTAAPVLAQEAPAPDFIYTEAPNDHALGSDTSAQTMIVYASVTCPHCGEWFSKEWPSVKKELVETDILRVIFRPLPTAPQQLSVTGFLLAECAPREDYYEIIEYQMDNQDAIYEAARAGKAKAEYDKIAKMAGMMDDNAIDACLRNPDMMSHIQESAMRLQATEAKGVPAFFINGEIYPGAQDADSLVKLIKDIDAKGITALPDNIKAAQPAQTDHDHSANGGQGH